jgi:hypothetical protein
MSQSRRRVLAMLTGAGLLLTKPYLSFAQTPQPMPSPHAPNPSFPPGLEGPDMRPDSEKKMINPQNQRQIREDVQKLYELVTEFKDQVEKTDLNTTISLSVVKKAQQVEKLAKHIKDLAKG